MSTVKVLVAAAALLLSHIAAAEVARHESIETNASGVPQNYSVVYADDAGNLRMEIYGAAAAAGDAVGGDVDVEYSAGALEGVMIFQAAEERMLVIDGGECQAMGADMPGMPPGGLEQYREEMAEAQRQLQELAEQDPAMAQMLQERMAGMGIPGMMQEQPEVIVEETGENRTVGDYATTQFVVYEQGSDRYRTNVWAADIDDVAGGRIVGGAMAGFFEHFRDVMDRIGIGSLTESRLSAAILEKMNTHYPVMTESEDRRTTLIGAEAGVSADFYPDCG